MPEAQNDILTVEQTPFKNVQRVVAPPSYVAVGLSAFYELSRAAAIQQPIAWRTTIAHAIEQILTEGAFFTVRVMRYTIRLRVANVRHPL